jgi:archaellum biogenesis protein FlaJ (TadC family)
MTLATTASTTPTTFEQMLAVMGFVFILIMGLLCLMLLIKMWRNEINLSSLLEEANGQASMSRFQLLVFTLVVAVGLFLYILYTHTLPQIPHSILILLGISSSTYAVGKGISFSRPEGVLRQPGTMTSPPPTSDHTQQPG